MNWVFLRFDVAKKVVQKSLEDIRAGLGKFSKDCRFRLASSKIQHSYSFYELDKWNEFQLVGKSKWNIKRMQALIFYIKSAGVSLALLSYGEF